MVKDSAKGNFEVVLVWKLDRFARNRYDSAHYKTILRKNGVKVVSATEHISQGAEGILLESMLEGMAEYYSAELAEKVKRGMTENALKCKYNGGTLPVGYTVDENKFYQLDPVVAPIVADAFMHYAEGSSMREVVDELNIRGVRNTRGGKISINNVTNMLHNRKYMGEYKFDDVIVPNGVPAIVSEELFERVQERMAKNKKAPAKHKAEDEYLLTTKLYCGKCGCFMIGESGHSRKTDVVHRYYKCVGVKRRKDCDKKNVKKEWLENIVIDQIKMIVNNDDIINDLADAALAALSKENTTLPLLRKEYAKTQASIDNLLTAMEQGIITPSTKERLEKLEQQKSELSIQIIKEEASQPTVTKDEILFWFYQFRKLDTNKLEHRRRLIDSFINAIFLYDNRMVLIFNYKEGTKTITFDELQSSPLGSDLTASGGPPLGSQKCRFYPTFESFLFCESKLFHYFFIVLGLFFIVFIYFRPAFHIYFFADSADRS